MTNPNSRLVELHQTEPLPIQSIVSKNQPLLPDSTKVKENLLKERETLLNERADLLNEREDLLNTTELPEEKVQEFEKLRVKEIEDFVEQMKRELENHMNMVSENIHEILGNFKKTFKMEMENVWKE